jgi:hypothetical protein
MMRSILKMRKNRRAQEEMVGFVLIVVIVAIIFIIFLAIFLRRGAHASAKESADVYQFLQGAMEYTTECAVSYEPAFSSLGELIKDCYSGATCTSGKSACAVLNQTVANIVESGWRIGPERPFRGYIFNSTYKSDNNAKTVLYQQRGNCSFNMIGGETLIAAYPGSISTTLRMCS